MDQVMNEAIYNLVNIFFQVVLWSLIISAPAIILTIEMYAYEKYKKWKNNEEKEYEQIIVSRAKETIKHDEHIGWQKQEQKKLDLEIDLLNVKKKSLQDEVGVPEESDEDKPEENLDLNSMKRVEMLALAKERGHKMYSKLNKQQLIKLLSD